MTSRIALPIENSGEARHMVRSTLGGASAETVEIAELLVSELVSNALVHGLGDATLIAEITRLISMSKCSTPNPPSHSRLSHAMRLEREAAAWPSSTSWPRHGESNRVSWGKRSGSTLPLTNS